MGVSSFLITLMSLRFAVDSRVYDEKITSHLLSIVFFCKNKGFILAKLSTDTDMSVKGSYRLIFIGQLMNRLGTSVRIIKLEIKTTTLLKLYNLLKTLFFGFTVQSFD